MRYRFAEFTLDSAHRPARFFSRSSVALAASVAVVLILGTLALLWQGDRVLGPASSNDVLSLAIVINADSTDNTDLKLTGLELLSVALAADQRVRVVRGDGRDGYQGINDRRWQR